METKEEKQSLLRERILDKGVDVVLFMEFLNTSQKGTELNSYTYQELIEIIDEFLCAQRLPKQEYLQKEIANGMYDLENFLQYMRNQKINGDDIDNWTMDELQEVVQVYQLDYEWQQEPMQKQPQQQDKNRQDLLRTSMIKISSAYEGEMNLGDELPQNNNYRQSSNYPLQSIQEVNENNVDDSRLMQQKFQEFFISNSSFKYKQKFYSKTIQCPKETSQLPKNQKLKITISNWKRDDGKFFGLYDRHIKYEVSTQPFNWKVLRRMSEFSELRKVLVKFFPGKYIPPLDNNFRENTDYEIGQRIQCLTHFCNHLKNHEEIWSNMITQTFFSKNIENEWENMMKTTQQQKESDKAITSMTGNLRLEVSEQNQVYNKEIQNYFAYTQDQLEKLELHTEKIVECYNLLNEEFNAVTQINQNLTNSIKQFNTEIRNNIQDHTNLYDVFDSNEQLERTQQNLTNIIKSWSKQTGQQAKISDTLKHLYKYQKLSLHSTKDNFKQLEKYKQNYLHFQQSSQKQFQDTTLEQSQMVFQTRYKSELKQNIEAFGYWSQSVYQDSQNMIKNTSNDIISFMNYFSRFQTLSVNEMLKQWGKNIEPYFNNPFPQPRQQQEEINLEKSIVRRIK